VKAHEITSAVQQSAGIDAHDHAEQAVRATLTVLGQRLSTEAGTWPPSCRRSSPSACGAVARLSASTWRSSTAAWQPKKDTGVPQSRLGSTRGR
jgi:hypothetical protein